MATMARDIPQLTSTATIMRAAANTIKIMAIAKMNRAITVKTVTATKDALKKEMMIAGFVGMNVSIKDHMVMKEEEILNTIIMAGSMQGLPYGLNKLYVTNNSWKINKSYIDKPCCGRVYFLQ